jgi:hypothetical protein
VNWLGTVTMHGGPGRGVKLAAWLAAAGLLAAGCADAPTPTVKLTTAEIGLLTESGGTPVAAAKADNAFQVLVQRCMQSKGFVYYPVIETATSIVGLAGIPQASITLAARKADGYGFYSRVVQNAVHPGGQDPLPREEKYVSSLPVAVRNRYLMALHGPNNKLVTVTFPGGGSAQQVAGGCWGSAARRLYGSVANWVQEGTGLAAQRAQFLSAVTADPSFTDVIARWSKCMIRHGMKYTSPGSLWNSLGRRVDRAPTPTLRDLEIKVSVRDYQCAATVALLPTVRALQAAHAKYLSKTLAGNLARITQIYARALKVAKALHVTG